MKKAIRYILAALFSLVAIFLLVNVQLGFIYKLPEMVQVTFKEPLTIEQILEKNPNLKLVDREKAIFSTGAKVQSSMFKIAQMPGVQKVEIAPEMPEFYWSRYIDGMVRVVDDYTRGDFGLIFTKTSSVVKPLATELEPMIVRTSTYFFAALGAAIAIGLTLPIVASKFRIVGWLFDGIHRMLMTLPDFLVVVLITYLAIYLSRFSSQRLVLIMQINKEVPFLIPFLTIALIPAILIYGTVRDALRRELERAYIATALAKGLSRTRVIVTHAMRNVMEDVFSVLPRATTAAVTSMIIAEVTCSIMGLGGFLAGPYNSSPAAMPVICLLLAAVSFLLQGLYALFRKWLVVSTKEAEA